MKSEYYQMVNALQRVPIIRYVVGNVYRSDFLFVDDRTGVPLLYRWDAGQIQVITPGDEPVTGFAALHKEKPYIVFTNDVGGAGNFTVYFCDYSTNKITEIADNMGIIRNIFWIGDDTWLVMGFDKKENFIKKVSRSNCTPLFTTDKLILPATYDDNQKVVAAQVGRGPGSNIVVVDITGKIRWISESDTSEDTNPQIYSEKGLIAYKTDVNTSEIVIRSVNTLKEITRVLIPQDIGFLPWYSSMAWVDDNTLLCTMTKNGQVFLRLLTLSDNQWSEPLTDMTTSSPSYTRKGPVWTASSFNQPPCIQTLQKGAVITLVKPEYTGNIAGESHWYTTFDGRKVQGWLFRSHNTRGCNPLVVLCHGGPNAAVVPVWNPDIQELVLAGYNVFAPNFRGSTTFGPEFENLNIGDLGGGDVKDVLYGAQYAANILNTTKKPAIIGGSYGGYLVMMALTTQPEAWAGGVAFVPLVDLVEDYTLANAVSKAYSAYLMGGTLDEKFALYKERSPITHIKTLKAPVLIIAGENDPQSPLPPIQKFYDKAQELNLPVELAVFKEEGHTAARVLNAVKATVCELEFLKRLFYPQ
jgi:dipeptidyl aminopeptidase/acylaminoacyl peptidase